MNDIDMEFETKWNCQEIQNVMNNIAARYKRNIDVDDIESIKMDVLWRCVKKYDPNKGCKFTSYLYQQFSYAMKNKVKKKSLEFNVISGHIDAKTIDRMEIVDIITGLDAEDYQIIQQRFYDNLTMKEIGVKNGYSRETARRKLKNVLTLCKNICDS
jgi:RNA polymerase sigma factor (sigma-70 family)